MIKFNKEFRDSKGRIIFREDLVWYMGMFYIVYEVVDVIDDYDKYKEYNISKIDKLMGKNLIKLRYWGGHNGLRLDVGREFICESDMVEIINPGSNGENGTYPRSEATNFDRYFSDLVNYTGFLLCSRRYPNMFRELSLYLSDHYNDSLESWAISTCEV